MHQTNYSIDEPKLLGHTSIHLAIDSGHYELVKFLLDFTKKPMAADVAGCTPIHTAAFRGNLEVIKLLVDYTNNPA